MKKTGLNGQSQHDWRQRYDAKKVATPCQALLHISRGSRIFIASNCGVPEALTTALATACEDIVDCEIVHLLTQGDAPTVDLKLKDRFRHNAFFIGANVREAVNKGQADYTPIFLSEVPELFRSGRMPLDVALIMVSPPDDHGFCSLAIAVDVGKAALESAKYVVAQINPRMPRTHGDTFVHVDRLSAVYEQEAPIAEYPPGQSDPVTSAIGKLVATQIPDGATLQTGIGKIPDAVLAALGDKKDLGIYTEMFSDGVIDLVQSGVVTGRKKNIHPGKIVSSFCMGTQRLYDFVHDNPIFEFHPTEYINDPFRIAQHDNMISVNSAIEVDLTGQVCADSLGSQFFSGFGGQVDFVRGASRSKGGKAFICLPSTARGGKISRIVSFLQLGAGVTTSRGDVRYIVTEYGIADLFGKSVRERSLALIQIAHPDFRAELFAQAKKRGLVEADQPAPREHSVEIEDLQFYYGLDDGREVRIRTARLTDERALQEMWYDLSKDTLLRRYVQQRTSLPRHRVREILDFDGHFDLSLVATIQEQNRERIIALGRFNTDQSTGYAELGILIHDDFQSKGLGSFLLSILGRQARANGLRGFSGAVPLGNYEALELFQSFGLPVDTHTVDGVTQMRLSFENNEPEFRP